MATIRFRNEPNNVEFTTHKEKQKISTEVDVLICSYCNTPRKLGYKCQSCGASKTKETTTKTTEKDKYYTNSTGPK
jgi:primosomal protein N'